VTGVGLNLAPAEEYERKVGAPLPAGAAGQARALRPRCPALSLWATKERRPRKSASAWPVRRRPRAPKGEGSMARTLCDPMHAAQHARGMSF